MGWSDMLPEILGGIVHEFDNAGDFVRFACVCSSWRAVAMDWRSHVSPQLPRRVSVFPRRRLISSYDPLVDQTVMVPYPMGLDGEIIGSGCGWMVVLMPQHDDVYLLSPFLDMQLDLPSLRHYDDDVFWMVEGYFLDDVDPIDAIQHDSGLVYKVVVVRMSGAPGSFGAIAIYNGSARLAYAKPGDELWTSIGVERSYYRDAVLYEGLLYAIDAVGFIRIYDFVGGIVRADVDIQPYIFRGTRTDFFTSALRYRFYIVATETDIYIVARGFTGRVTTDFALYRMDTNTRELARVEHIGDYTFFIGGTTSSTSVRSGDFIGIARSSIWYTADYPHNIRPDVPYDVGFFDVELGTFERVPMFSQLESRGTVTPPVWITRFPW